MAITRQISLLVQSVLYICLVVGGIASVVFIGQEFASFPQKECVLFNDFKYKALGSTRYLLYMVLSSNGVKSCHYAIAISATSILYGIVLLVLCLYYMCGRSKQDKDLMVLPLCISNTVLFLLLLVASSLISAGLDTFCSSFMDVSQTHLFNFYKKCSDIADYKKHYSYNLAFYTSANAAGNPQVTWGDFSFYKWMYMAQIASWSLCLVSLLLAVFNWIRLCFDMRRAKSAGDRTEIMQEVA